MAGTLALATAAIRRRRLQTIIIAVVLMLATFAATVALDILVGTQAPFDSAFEAANGAHLVVTFNGATDPAAIAATASVAGVTQAAGPYDSAPAGFEVNPDDDSKGGLASYASGILSDRPDPDSGVDRLTVISGRWWQAPGEIVLSRAQASISGDGHDAVGDTFDLVSLPNPEPGGSAAQGPPVTVTLHIVGIAASLSTPAVRGWVSPVDLEQFVAADHSPDQVMLYRVVDPGSQTSLGAVAAAIAAALPQGAIASTSTWLALQTSVNDTAQLMVPILLAFAAFAFLAAAFIIVNVVSGVVVGNMRQLGLMKAIGATPRDVSAVLVAQVMVPALVGAIAGTALGALASQPIMGDSAAALGVPALGAISPAVLVGVLVVALAVTFAAAVGPAVRGSRLTAVEALTRGAAPGSALRRTNFPLPAWMPDAAALGFHRIGARPLRTLMTCGALMVGVAALTFTLGMESSLRNVGTALFRDRSAPVRISLPGGGQGPVGAKPGPPNPQQLSPDQVETLIVRQPATSRYVAIGEADVSVPSLATTVPFYAYRGDSSWIGYVQTAGRWFSAPGEVDVPDNFLTQTGLHIGDSFMATVNGEPLSLVIVGSILDNARSNDDGPQNVLIRGDWATLVAADPTLEPSGWEVATNPIMSPDSYAQQISEQTSGFADASVPSSADTDRGFLFFESVIASLGAILALVSLGGVANTVLLEARERLRETATLRALGMTPRQVMTMTVASVLPLGLVAAVLGIPIGAALQRSAIETMAQTAIASSVPASITGVFGPTELAFLVCAGLAIALIGAWLPARRSASTSIAGVLASE